MPAEYTPATMQRFIDQESQPGLCRLCELPCSTPPAHESCLRWVGSDACREQCRDEGTQEIPQEVIEAMYRELYASVPVDLPSEEEVETMFAAAGEPNPFKGSN